MSFPLRTYSADQAPTILRLLQDYVKRLQGLLDQAERTRENKVTVIVQIILIAVTALVAYLAPIYLNEIFVIPVVVAISSIWFHSAVGSLRYLFVERHKSMRVQDEVKLLAKQLEDLLRIALQVEEHTRQNSATRLEFDFQITLTEETLRRAKEYR